MARQKRAFTVIELLVVIAIIGLLLALTVPAIQMAREASRRTQCKNNLKSIGLALQNYHAAYDQFPAGWYSGVAFLPSGAAHTKRFSPFTMLLPYLEQTEVFNSINFSQSFDWFGVSLGSERVNATVVKTVIGAFLCPSDGQRLSFAGNVNYRVSLGPGPYLSGDQTARFSGAFSPWFAYSARDFTDGLGTTIGLSEKLVGDGSDGRFDSRRDHWYSAAANTNTDLDPDTMYQVCAAQSSALPVHFSLSGLSWMLADYEDTFYNHVSTPNSYTADCSAVGGPHSSSGGMFSARSYHANGVSCCMMDGSVRFISSDIDLHIWRGLSTRGGGETNSHDSF